MALFGAKFGLFWSTLCHFYRFGLLLVGFCEKEYVGRGDMALALVGAGALK